MSECVYFNRVPDHEPMNPRALGNAERRMIEAGIDADRLEHPTDHGHLLKRAPLQIDGDPGVKMLRIGLSDGEMPRPRDCLVKPLLYHCRIYRKPVNWARRQALRHYAGCQSTKRPKAFVFWSFCKSIDLPTEGRLWVHRPKKVASAISSNQFVVEVRDRQLHRIADAMNEQLSRRHTCQSFSNFRPGQLIGDESVLNEPRPQMLPAVENLLLIFGK